MESKSRESCGESGSDGTKFYRSVGRVALPLCRKERRIRNSITLRNLIQGSVTNAMPLKNAIGDNIAPFFSRRVRVDVGKEGWEGEKRQDNIIISLRRMSSMARYWMC